MKNTNWIEIEQIFHEALESTPDERDKLIEHLRKKNPSIAANLLNLLESHFSSEDFLDQTLLDISFIEPGDNVGPWKIIREIGFGGMSKVFLAERNDERFSRQVAIKFLHGMAPGKEMSERLKNEQKILATLNHKNICKLLDAGIHQSGRPYFIMEYIDGLPIDIWCNRHNLAVEERLKLFIQVCEAVAYAHQHLVIHRDLKPSNILVNSNGDIKLLDFGIAKIITEEASDISKTLTGFQIMTPEYASPEQIQNRRITTATDVYGLGLLLYIILTGRHPFNLNDKSPIEIGQIITQTKPEKPSNFVTKPIPVPSKRIFQKTFNARIKQNNAVLKQLSKKLRGDLDNIILKALRKEPDRRYQSAEQFSSDIRLYLENKPVSAQPETHFYRTKKFIQRNKKTVFAAVCISFLLLISSAFSYWQAAEANRHQQIAEQRFKSVWDLTNTLVFDIHDSIVNLPGSTTARELIVERALNYLDELSKTPDPDSELLIDIATAYRKIGDVQGNPTNANLGRHREAMDSYQKGLRHIETVRFVNPENRVAQRVYANIYEKIGDMLAVTGQLSNALEHKQISLEAYKKLTEEAPDIASAQIAYAISLIKLGDLLGNPNFTNMEQPGQAKVHYLGAENILVNLYNENSADSENIRLLGLIYERLGTIFETEEHLEEALWNYQRSMELRKEFVKLNPLNTNAIRDEAVAYEKLANVQRQTGQLQEAYDNYQQSFDIFTWLSDIDPNNIQAQQSLAVSHIHLGNLTFHPDRTSFNRPQQSAIHFRTSKKILENALKSDSTNSRTKQLLSISENRLNTLNSEGYE